MDVELVSIFGRFDDDTGAWVTRTSLMRTRCFWWRWTAVVYAASINTGPLVAMSYVVATVRRRAGVARCTGKVPPREWPAPGVYREGQTSEPHNEREG